ncbi:eugenol synthase 1-like isoform X2 [Henckelia pumila]|uniref:eugenol synthase 1-like isoform X2 n=1 Tax=Henckelia pumila TaxID=405737 RepID=UPI003C6E81A3
MAENKSKILLFGGSGYIGRHMVRASIKLGHPTYVYSRPHSDHSQVLNELQSFGAIIVKGQLDDHVKLVSALREVDVVISALAYPQVLDQINIIEAIKVAGNIKRFLPSDFGCEEDRIISVLPPFQAFLDKKKRVRRAIEEANIPYTYVSANCFGAYFVNYLLRPYEQNQEITVYGTAVLNYEEDIGIYTIKVATDPKACNRVVIFRPRTNMISQLELIALWEKKTGRSFSKIHVPEQELVTLSNTLPDPLNIPVSIIHSVFVKGVTTDFEIGGDDIEASVVYRDQLKFTTIEELLDIFLHDPPPKPALAAFE